ncbi:MAG: hypothetical protein Q8R57_05510 [Bacteroidota bacterium]|nr:hypothetical protein [Bacteroidota bacterium]
MKNIVLCILAAFCLVNCKKTEVSMTEQEKPQTNYQILVQNKWKIASDWITTETESYDAFKNVDTFHKDNWFVFNSDSLMVQYTGLLKCNASEAESLTIGKWQVSSDFKTFSYSPISGQQKVVFEVKEINNNVLLLESKDQIPGLKMTRLLRYVSL